MELGLKNKKVLVVASSQGLGKSISREFVKEGAHVVITSRRMGKLQEVKAEFDKIDQGQTEVIKADITNPQDIKALLDDTKSKLGGLDILVNNAGGPPAGNFMDFEDEDWQKAFELNLLSYIRIIREAMPLLSQSGDGRIINIASSSVKQPIPGLILSNTFRMGILGMTKTIAEEFGHLGIRVHTAAPGRIATDRVEHLDKFNADKEGKAIEMIRREREENIPLGRYGEPEEFAKCVLFLASSLSTYMTGQTFMIDGGMIRSY